MNTTHWIKSGGVLWGSKRRRRPLADRGFGLSASESAPLLMTTGVGALHARTTPGQDALPDCCPTSLSRRPPLHLDPATLRPPHSTCINF
jgi:hypothetical protein